MVNGAPETQRHGRALKRLASLTLVLLSLAVYGQTLTFEFINLDDNQYVTENPHVLGGLSADSITWAFTPTGYAANWHPLVWLSLMLDTELYGNWAGGFHLTNVLLHTLNSVLVFRLLDRMTGESARSFVVAALFAVHPLHVESVAWVTERKDVLGTLFGLSSLIAYGRSTGQGRLGWLLVAWVGMLLSLMCKQMLVTLPCLFLLLDYWPLRRATLASRAWLRLVAEKAPFIALSAVFCGVALWSQRTGGALYSWDKIPLGPRLSNAVVSYAIYLRETVWPTDLAVFYPYPPTGHSAFAVAGSALLLVVLTVGALWRPWLLVGWLWFLVTLLPVIGIIQVGEQAHADRYMYFPQIGLCIAATWSVAEVLRARTGSSRPAAVLAAAVLLALTAVGWKQTRVWRDSVTLFRHAVQVTEENWLAHGTLGAALLNTPKTWGEAEQHLRESLRIRPNNATAHYNLALVLSDHGDLSQANKHFREALLLKPDYWRARLLLCVNLKRLGQLDELAKEQPQLGAMPEFVPGVLQPALDYLSTP